MATCFPSLKPFKLVKQDMQDTAGEAKTISQATFSNRCATVVQQAKTYIGSCTDTECSLEDLPGAMDEKDG